MPRVNLKYKEWKSSFDKWTAIVVALRDLNIGKARAAFHRKCGYCAAFNRACKKKNEDLDWEVVDRCTGCPLEPLCPRIGVIAVAPGR